MPSPIAHCSMTLLIKPLDKRGLIPDSIKRHRISLLALLLFACVLPDMDFLVGAVAKDSPLGQHGLGMHSLVMASVGSLVLALLWTAVYRKGFVAVLLLALAATWCHLFLDMMTYRSRGIGLLWPFVGERYRLPFNVFYGVRHSGSGNWLDHLITVSSESAFFLLVWGICCLFMRGGRPSGPRQAVEIERV